LIWFIEKYFRVIKLNITTIFNDVKSDVYLFPDLLGRQARKRGFARPSRLKQEGEGVG
jgi:hypothetical protein